MAAFINVRMSNRGSRRQHSIAEEHDESIDELSNEVEKHLKKTGSTNETVIERRASKELRVMLVGNLESPYIKCIKELRNLTSDSSVIPLAVRKTGGAQKFRIPFKNVSTS